MLCYAVVGRHLATLPWTGSGARRCRPSRRWWSGRSSDSWSWMLPRPTTCTSTCESWRNRTWCAWCVFASLRTQLRKWRPQEWRWARARHVRFFQAFVVGPTNREGTQGLYAVLHLACRMVGTAGCEISWAHGVLVNGESEGWRLRAAQSHALYLAAGPRAMHRVSWRTLEPTTRVEDAFFVLSFAFKPVAPIPRLARADGADSYLRWSTMTVVLLRPRSSTDGLIKCRPRSTMLPTARDLTARKGRQSRCTAWLGWDVRRFWWRLLLSSTERQETRFLEAVPWIWIPANVPVTILERKVTWVIAGWTSAGWWYPSYIKYVRN